MATAGTRRGFPGTARLAILNEHIIRDNPAGTKLPENALDPSILPRSGGKVSSFSWEHSAPGRVLMVPWAVPTPRIKLFEG